MGARTFTDFSDFQFQVIAKSFVKLRLILFFLIYYEGHTKYLI